jgi:hypothetical protein
MSYCYWMYGKIDVLDLTLYKIFSQNRKQINVQKATKKIHNNHQNIIKFFRLNFEHPPYT